MRSKFTLLTLFVLFIISILPSMAQEVEYTVLVDGLNNPRGLNFDADGVLYVAEAGLGGDIDVDGPFGPTTFGFSAGISAVVDGEVSKVISYLPSMSMNEEIVGAMDVLPTADRLWVVMGHEIGGITLAGTVVNYDRVSLRPSQIFDVFGYEHANDPDGTGELLSNVTSIALAPDEMSALIVDASGNTLYRASADGALDVVTSWENNPVPTSVTFNSDGSQYAVGFLMGFPFPTGAARVELYDSATDELITTYEGLTTITDVLFDVNDFLLVVSYGEFSGETFSWIPNSGSVTVILPDGSFVSGVTGLNFPYSIAQNPVDDMYAVSVNSVGEAGSGIIITFSAP